jgi:hypothetical protein
MESLKRIISLCITLCICITFLPQCQGQAAYIYYTDAECLDNVTISGTFNLAYDTDYLEGYGYSTEGYEGECIYFVDGSFDLSNYGNYYAGDSMQGGYCTSCDGSIHCTSDGSCDSVSEVDTSNLYQLSEVSHSAYQNNQKEEVTAQAFKKAEELDNTVMQMISNDVYDVSGLGGGGQGGSSPMYAFLGIGIACGVWFGLLASLEGHRQWRNRRSTGNVELTENLSPVV